jgi:hypothetical protein
MRHQEEYHIKDFVLIKIYQVYSSLERGEKGDSERGKGKRLSF